MKPNKWPDFLFTITVRFVVGIVLGGCLGGLFSATGILNAFAHNNTHVPIMWLGLCALAGGLVAVFTVPRWQTPWYRREPVVMDVKNSVTIETVGPDGERHEYTSLEEVPPEIRSEIEAFEKEAAQDPGGAWTVSENSDAGFSLTKKITRTKHSSIYRIVDESGLERTYHSLEEMPPELRAAVVEAEKKRADERNNA